MWLRLTRSNNLVKSFYSPDGQNWTLYYSRSINLGSNPIAGLVTAKNGARARFDNLSLSSMGMVTATVASEKPALQARIFPNPGNRKSWLEWHSDHSGDIRLSIRDLSGRLIETSIFKLETGKNLLPLHAAMLSGGTFLVEAASGKQTVYLRWVVQ